MVAGSGGSRGPEWSAVSSTTESVQTLDLRDYFSVLWRRKTIVVLALLVVAVSAFLLSNRQDKVYKASSSVLLNVAKPDDATIDTQLSVLGSDSVRKLAQTTVPNLPRVSASRQSDSQIITVAVESTDPQLPAKAVDAYVTAYTQFASQQLATLSQQTIDQINAKLAQLQPQLDQANIDYANGQASILDEFAPVAGESSSRTQQRAQERAVAVQNLEQQVGARRTSLNSQVLVLNSQLLDVTTKSQTAGPPATVVTGASVPTSPVSPKPMRDLLLGGTLGLILGIALAFGFDYLDDTVKSRFDVERSVGRAGTVLASVAPAPNRRGTSNLVVMTDPFSPTAEAYRSLRTSIQFAAMDKPLKVLTVTSPSVGDGKTTTVANLAVATARTGRRVVLVDSDLRRPRLHEYFGIGNDVGLTSVMIGDCTLQQALKEMPDIPRLSVLPSGPLPPNPSELLSLRRFPEVMNLLRQHADLVLIDSPPLLPVTDPTLIAAHADAVLVVVSEGSTTRKQLREAFEILHKVDASILGVLLNNSETASTTNYSYYHRPSRRGLNRLRREREANLVPEPPRTPRAPSGKGTPGRPPRAAAPNGHADASAAKTPVESGDLP